MQPYKDLEITDSYIIREFSQNIDPIELMWHRDDQDRTIEIIGKTDYSIQLEDSLPISLIERIFIKRPRGGRSWEGAGVGVTL